MACTLFPTLRRQLQRGARVSAVASHPSIIPLPSLPLTAPQHPPPPHHGVLPHHSMHVHATGNMSTSRGRSPEQPSPIGGILLLRRRSSAHCKFKLREFLPSLLHDHILLSPAGLSVSSQIRSLRIQSEAILISILRN